MAFYVYIIYSQSADRYYVGHTENTAKRLEEHNIRKNLGANDWVLKYVEQFDTRAEAMQREKEIKAKSEEHIWSG